MPELIVALLCIPATAWAFAWYTSRETRAVPQILAQAQEQVKQEQAARERTLKLFLSRVDAQALAHYQQMVASIEPQGPVPDHSDPAMEHGTKALEAKLTALRELEQRQATDMTHGYDGHTAIAGESP